MDEMLRRIGVDITPGAKPDEITPTLEQLRAETTERDRRNKQLRAELEQAMAERDRLEEEVRQLKKDPMLEEAYRRQGWDFDGAD